MRMHFTLGSLALLVVAGCGGTTLDGGETSRPDALRTTDGGVATSPADFSAAQVAAARAACDAPHGPVDDAPTWEAAAPKLIGAWYLCSEPNVYYLTKSIEFTGDGTSSEGKYFLLEDNGAGGLTRARGIDREGAWSFVSGRWLNFGMYPEFESSPRRLRMTVATSGFKNWYVPLGD